MIEHRAFCSAFIARAEHIRRDSHSRVFQFASYSFHTHTEDNLMTLMFGGCICIPSEYDRATQPDKFMRDARVNCAHITPSVLNLIPAGSVPSLEVLLLGGEPMTNTNLHDWVERAVLMNVYGPIEACVTATYTPTHTVDPRFESVQYRKGRRQYHMDC
jgi:non-ribosomal peptide synthetase component F